MKKLKKLKDMLGRMQSALVAFSGGVDSTFLLKVASQTLGQRVIAVTADSLTYTRQELELAKKSARAMGVKHLVIKTREFKDKDFVRNPLNRCYFCKKELFGELKKLAKKNKLNFVLDASTVSDLKDFRPGVIAKKEFGARSPLQEAGFTKEDVRRWSKKLGLKTWNMPSQACLASRIPYGVKIEESILKRIENSENFLRRLGFEGSRVRHYNGLCRIEVPKKDIQRLLGKSDKIVEYIKRQGYNFVTVDLEGYRTGSMNPGLTHQKVRIK